MPVLPTYSAQIGGAPINGGRRAVAEDLYAGDASGGKMLAKAAENYLADTEDKEARKAVVDTTEIRAKYARALDQAALNGDDLGALKEQMSAELSKVGEQFQTKKGDDSLRVSSANSELMFDEQANRINVQRATEDAKLEAGKFLNGASAIIQSNPLYLKEAEANAEALSHTFKGVRSDQRLAIADGLKRELNMAAALGSARVHPEDTKRKLEGGEWNLTPDQRNLALSKADTEIRAKRADEDHQRALDEYDSRKRDESARDTQFAAIIGGTATRRSIMDDADLKPTTREHLITYMEARTKELTGQEKKSDPVTLRNLWLDIHRPDGDPLKIFNGDKIFEAVKKGLVNTTDANGLNTLVANQRDENGRVIGSKLSGQMSIVGRALSADPRYTAQPALVAEIQMEYQGRVFDKVAQYRAEKKNPNDLFNPANKDFVGSREFIQGSIDAGKEKQRVAMPQAVTVNSQDEYNALEPGTPYVDSKGVRGIKKGAAKAPTGKGPTVSGTIRTAE